MIVVTGGSGMVGRSLQRILPEATFLTSSDYDLTKESQVIKMYEDLKPKVVIHLAARVGGIIDNIKYPGEYFTQNILMNTLLVEYARINNVNRFIGILSTCIYPDVVDSYPMSEDLLHVGPPTRTNFSYGYAKRSLSVQIDSYNEQYGTNYQYLIPCNMYGEDDKFGDNSHFIASLIKKIVRVKREGEKVLKLFGTGKPLRQILHSDDLAWIIKQCINKPIYDSFNVADSHNQTIEEIANVALEACGLSNINIEFDSDKPDGQFRKDVCIAKLNHLLPEFKPTPLHIGIKKVYDKFSKRYDR